MTKCMGSHDKLLYFANDFFLFHICVFLLLILVTSLPFLHFFFLVAFNKKRSSNKSEGHV